MSSSPSHRAVVLKVRSNAFPVGAITLPLGRVIFPVNVPVARVITVIQSPLPNWVGVWVVVDVYGGEHANHLLNHRGMRFPPFDRLWDPHDVCDYVWVMCRVHPCDVAGVEGVVALLHEFEEVGRAAGVEGHG